MAPLFVKYQHQLCHYVAKTDCESADCAAVCSSDCVNTSICGFVLPNLSVCGC